MNSLAYWNLLFGFPSGSSKNPSQERKATPTPREMSATKSPLSAVPDQQTYERLLQGLGAADVYRQIPLAFDPAALPRGIHIDPGTSTVFVSSALLGPISTCSYGGLSLVLGYSSVFDVFSTFSSGILFQCLCDLNLFVSLSNFLTNVASCAHSSVLHASPPGSQPGLPSSLPLPHPWFS